MKIFFIYVLQNILHIDIKIEEDSLFYAGERWRGNTMLEFAKLQKNALSLFTRLSEASSLGCSFFFQKWVQDSAAVDRMAKTIEQLGRALAKENNKEVIEFLQLAKEGEGLLTPEELEDFKRNVLMGGYLLIWNQANAYFPGFGRLGQLTELISDDLGISAIEDFDHEHARGCYRRLSEYCSIAHACLEKEVYSNLLALLGADVQLKIAGAMSLKMHNVEQSTFNVGKGFLETLGVKFQS